MIFTLRLLKKCFYQETEYGPAILQCSADTNSKGYRYSPAPSDLEFCQQIIPEFMRNPGHGNKAAKWPNKTTLSYIMNHKLDQYGMKLYQQELSARLLNPSNVETLMKHCDAYLGIVPGFSHENFQTVLNRFLQAPDNKLQYYPIDQIIPQLTRIHPGATLALLLVYALIYKEEAYQCIRNYINSDSGKQLLISCNIDRFLPDNKDEKATGQVESDFIGYRKEIPFRQNPYHFSMNYYYPDPITTFVGRNSYLTKMMSLLHNTTEQHHLFLYGMSGIGKTELAKKYAATYRSYYQSIHMLPYQNSLKETICFGISICGFDDTTARNNASELERVFHEKVAVLKQIIGERNLLIIDNMNNSDDPDLPHFLSQGFPLLITTQIDFGERGYQTLHVHALESRYENISPYTFGFSENPLLPKKDGQNLSDYEEPGITLTLFQKIYGRQLSDKDLVLVHHILTRFYGHTLITELLARQMKTSFLDASSLLDLLEESGISGTKTLEQVSHQYSNTPKAVYDYISSIISPDNLSQEEQYILKNLAVLPVQGISVRLLNSLCQLPSFDTLWRLKNRSLLIFQKEDNDEKVSLHPLIRDLIQTNLTASPDDFSKILYNLAYATRNCWNEPQKNAAKYLDITVSVLSVIREFSEETLLFAADLLEYCWQYGHFDLVIRKCEEFYSASVTFGYGHKVRSVICRVAGNCLYSTGIIYRKQSTRWFRHMLEECRQINDGRNSQMAYAMKNIIRAELNETISDFGLMIIPDSTDEYGYQVSYHIPYAEARITVREKLTHALQCSDEAIGLLDMLLAEASDLEEIDRCLSIKGDINYIRTVVLLYLHSSPENMLSQLDQAINHCYHTRLGLMRSLSITAAMTLQSKIYLLKQQYNFCDALLNQAYHLEESFRGTEQNPHLIRILIAKGDSAYLQNHLNIARKNYRMAKDLIDNCNYLDKGRYYEEVSDKYTLSNSAIKPEDITFCLTSGI